MPLPINAAAAYYKAMKIKISQILILAIVAVCFIPALSAQNPPQIKRIAAHPIASVNGPDLFREYCAVCHGSEAKGNGPAAAGLKTKPADLTLISRKNNNKYPELHVQNVIEGDDALAAHGSRDMPIWGQIFHHMSSNEDLGTVRIYNLVKYIEQIQAK